MERLVGLTSGKRVSASEGQVASGGGFAEITHIRVSQSDPNGAPFAGTGVPSFPP